MVSQASICRSVEVRGYNVYNGRRNSVRLHPANDNSGLVFRVNGKEFPADLKSAEHSRFGISLNSPSGRVYLVEHLLSAVYALGIDNLEIEIPDGVGPTTDNCAREYFDVLKVARVSQSAPKKYWRFAANSEVKVNGEDGKPDFLAVKPASRFVIGYSAYYPHRVIQNQRFRFEFSEEGYRDNVSEARPPGFLKNKIIIKILRFLNATEIYNGVNQTNYLWVSSKGAESCANPAGFGPRYGGDEFVRHKILDVIGTLALTGRHFKNTEFQFNMTGHRFDII